MPLHNSRRRLAAAALGAAIALVPAASAAARPHAHAAAPCRYQYVMPTHQTLWQVRSATLCLLNRQRAAHHLRTLRLNNSLASAAWRQSTLMVRQHFFSHTDPGGLDPVARLRDVGYIRATISWSIGENIAWGQDYLATPHAIMNAWMHSPEHRANILRSSFREVGIAIAPGTPVGGYGATYTTDFGMRG